MKPLSQHIQESLNEESKSILDIATRNEGKGLGLPESNSEEVVEEEEEIEKENPSDLFRRVFLEIV